MDKKRRILPPGSNASSGTSPDPAFSADEVKAAMQGWLQIASEAADEAARPADDAESEIERRRQRSSW